VNRSDVERGNAAQFVAPRFDVVHRPRLREVRNVGKREPEIGIAALDRVDRVDRSDGVDEPEVDVGHGPGVLGRQSLAHRGVPHHSHDRPWLCRRMCGAADADERREESEVVRSHARRRVHSATNRRAADPCCDTLRHSPRLRYRPRVRDEDRGRTLLLERLDAFVASRNAGARLTLDALRSGIRLQAVIHVAAEVAAYADEASAIVSDMYQPALHCREGCHYCCCKPNVLTSVPDFLRIVEHVRTEFSASDRTALAERVERYAAQVAGRRLDDPVDEQVPCPLLVDGRCSVYAVRPLVCRGYNSTSVEACRRASEDRSALVPIFPILKDVTDGATVGVAQQLRAAAVNDALLDLGTALRIALAAGDGFSTAVIDGDGALGPAENTSLVDDLWSAVRQTADSIGAALD
jgi:Fe-S-cluster containining protein